MKMMKSLVGCLLLGVCLVSFAGAETAGKVDLNTAGQEQFETLPGIGPSLAARIVEHRTKNRSFKRIEELMNVKGIGEKKFLKLKDLVFVGQSSSKKSSKNN